jgi:hypothetical protein
MVPGRGKDTEKQNGEINRVQSDCANCSVGKQQDDNRMVEM